MISLIALRLLSYFTGQCLNFEFSVAVEKVRDKVSRLENRWLSVDLRAADVLWQYDFVCHG